MPYKKRGVRNRRRRRVPGLATRPSMMSRTLAAQRRQQVSTKVFWFKQNGQLTADLNGDILYRWRTRNMLTPPAPIGVNNAFALYDQYKILAMKVRLFPAFVGNEPDTTLLQPGGIWRGDTCVWSDQRFNINQQQPTTIAEVINNASSRMINSRRPYSRALYRAKGNPLWGSTVNIATDPDPWDASIEITGNNFLPTPSATLPNGQVFWYYTVTWKLIFRGRRQI